MGAHLLNDKVGSEAQLLVFELGSDKGVVLCSHLGHLEMKRFGQIKQILN